MLKKTAGMEKFTEVYASTQKFRSERKDERKRKRAVQVCIAWPDLENSARGVLSLFKVINVFYSGPYKPPSRSNWTQSVQMLLKVGGGGGVRTSISKETYSHL